MNRRWLRKRNGILGLAIVALLWFGGFEVLAHAPYERGVGRFQRADGVTVFAVKRYVDGIFGEDPVSVQFRLADGTVLAATEQTRATVVVRKLPSGFEIYRFNSDLLPVAKVVQHFDGFVQSHRCYTRSCMGRSIYLSWLVSVFLRAH